MRTVLLSLVLVACGGAETTTTTATTTPSEPAAGYTTTPAMTEQATVVEPAGSCPIELEGATVVAQPLDDGIALVFITDVDHVGDLRARVNAFANTGELGHTARIGTVDAVATMTDTVDGVRLELRPVDPAQLGELRRQTRARVVAMETGACEPTKAG